MAACHGENAFPTFNSLFGCDFALLEMPYPTLFLPLASNNIGFEIKRKIQKKIDSDGERCDEDGSGDEIFVCFGKQMESKLFCKLPWTQESLFADKPCETKLHLEEYQSIMNPMRYI